MMFRFILPAVETNFPGKFLNRFLIFSSRFLLTADIHMQKMGWEAEKEKYVSMYESRHDEYWFKWQNIRTWNCVQGSDLPKAVNPLPGNVIDASKNDVLAKKIAIFSEDITRLKIDAIVNASNNYLKRGAGVDGAIHRAAGPFLQEECNTLNGCETGDAKITGGYMLPAKYVIQTVGPRGENPEALKNCYLNSLTLAMKNNLRAIAFPCISTGIYGYPNEPASHVAIYTARKFLEQHGDKFELIVFCTFLDIDQVIYKQVLQAYFPNK
ncbi:macro domain-containing protein PG1779-like isoform X1 [Euwallacea fornicatus]|uniref:macro domain-containing protein PG1779-like isoform X1 n=2 Tax=Euwallacea fornicatus TaxID=995702 RepID=UPI00338F51B6